MLKNTVKEIGKDYVEWIKFQYTVCSTLTFLGMELGGEGLGKVGDVLERSVDLQKEETKNILESYS